MLEVRFHGRGGQGAVTASIILANAAAKEGKYIQAFPSFGPERRGAPVAVFARISEEPIELRGEVRNPHVLVILDPTLMDTVNVFDGFKEGGIVVVNSPKNVELKIPCRAAVVDAIKVAMDTLKMPVVNTAILGAFVKATNIVTLDSMSTAILEVFPGSKGERNVNALRKAYEQTTVYDVNSAIAVKPSVEVKLPSYEEIAFGATILEPGSASKNLTGTWRVMTPVTDRSKCIKCKMCWMLCPDSSRIEMQDGTYDTDLNYCKGCGICAELCPVGAIVMSREAEKIERKE